MFTWCSFHWSQIHFIKVCRIHDNEFLILRGCQVNLFLAFFFKSAQNNRCVVCGSLVTRQYTYLLVLKQ